MNLFGIEFAPLLIPYERRLQTLAVGFITSTFMFFGITGILLNLYFFYYTSYFHYVPVIYLTWFFTDRNICNTGGRVLKCLRRSIIWKYMKDYFPIELIKTADLDPKKNYIMGYHPHGIIATGALCNFASEATSFSEKFPGITPRIITLKAQFRCPFHRDFILALGACSADKESIEYLLKMCGVGNAVVIVIGGAAEALDAHPKMSTLTLKRRRGFVRIAIQNGASLVPVYSFGENDLYDQIENPPGTWLRWFQTKITKIIGISPPLFKGRGMLQYNLGVLPYRRPINTVVGKPIDVVKNENPSDEEVCKIHEIYMEELKKLFDEHKSKYGYENQELVFV